MQKTALTRPFEASHYKLSTYTKCPRQYYFEYLDPDIAPSKKQIKQKRPALEIGNLVHDTLFTYYTFATEKRDLALLKSILYKKWPDAKGKMWGFTSVEEEREWFRDAWTMLKTFHESQDQSGQLFYVPDPFSREVLIKIPLDDQLVLQGRLDRVDEDGDDGLHVIDYKTGKGQDDDDFQVFTYVLLAERKFNRRVKRASYFYLRSGHWKTYTPGNGDIAVTLEKIKRLVKTIHEDEVFAPKPSQLCRFCDYIDYCPAKAEVMALLSSGTNPVIDDEEHTTDLPF